MLLLFFTVKIATIPDVAISQFSNFIYMFIPPFSVFTSMTIIPSGMKFNVFVFHVELRDICSSSQACRVPGNHHKSE
jgi:hypothetical protein